MRQKNKHTRLWLRKLARLHLILTILFLGTYMLVAFFDPGFLSYDLREKFHALADDTIVVTATVLPPPTKPVVSATPQCDSNTGNLSVLLDWADDNGATSFDIDRDSAPLVTGLSASTYTDSGVVAGTTYSYVVTANGPMGPGSETSDPASVTTPTDCVVDITASVHTVTIDGTSRTSFHGVPKIHNQKPAFTGTTNIANATITIHISGQKEFFGEVTANGNGYWSYRVPSNLDLGIQKFSVTATDPLNQARWATEHFHFRVSEEKDSSGNKGTVSLETEDSVSGGSASSDAVSPLSFTFTVLNRDSQLVQGSELATSLKIVQLEKRFENKELPLRFTILDERGNEVLAQANKETLATGKELFQNFSLPLYWNPGSYSVRAEIVLDGTTVSREIAFSLLELPLIHLGNEKTLSYSEIVKNIGWIGFFLLLLLLFWLFMLLREYGLAMRAKNQVTEFLLKKDGYFDQ